MQTYYRSDESFGNNAVASPWLIGVKEDTLFFFLPVFAALAIFALAQHPLVNNSFFLAMIAAYGFGLGPFHQGASWFTYFDKENFAYYASNNLNRFRFFVMPPLLIFIGIVATIACPQFLFAVLVVLHIDHLLQQSVRLARLYRQEGKFATANFKLEAISQYCVAAACTMIGAYRFDFLQFCSVPYALVATGIASVAAVLATAAYIEGIVRQHRAGSPLQVPALLFWAVSLLAWVPAIFVTNFFHAFLIPLTIHWFQFIGMNAVLVERKAAKARGTNGKMLLAPVLTLLAMCFIYMSIFIGIDFVCHTHASVIVKGLCLGVLAGLAMCHYSLDTFIWRFQDDYPREHILPYILPKR
ncbi:MAG: hypothetical protein IT343_12400 [Candidatus Melainabacteria bacterium]|jgi:L-fucose mutarotase/ribose pyranase (RbsD/FucU family)|nr:hypothetical protein [Candidatus Melainabacteria bacterium]